jgi:hypothetical protein
VPRHQSFLLKIKIAILDIFYISLSVSLTGEEGVRTLASIKHAHTHPLYLSERERGRERERACPHPCKHDACL